MSNYDERLDEILETVIAEAFIFGNFALGKGVDVKLPDDNHELPPKEKAKQAIIDWHNKQVRAAIIHELKEAKHSSDAGRYTTYRVAELEKEEL